MLRTLAASHGRLAPLLQPAATPAALSQVQALRGITGGADHGKKEPVASPWIKVLERPGDEHGNRSEDNPATNPYANPEAADVADDVPEKNPDRQPQAPIDPEVLAAASANPSVDSVRHMAGKVNEAVGGSYDFPKTGGATVRAMASEIGSNIGDKLGVHRDEGASPPGHGPSVASKAEDAAERAADSVAEGARSVYEAAKDVLGGGGGSGGGGTTDGAGRGQ